MALKLNLDSLDELDGLIPHIKGMDASGTPSPQPMGTPSVEPPPAGPMPSTPHTVIPSLSPTTEANLAGGTKLQPGVGKELYKSGLPAISAQPFTPENYQQKQEKLDYEAQHPWGSPVSEHPGVGGKIAHIASKVGNIAGDIFAPATMANIPGTDLNKQRQERSNERGFDEANKNELEAAGAWKDLNAPKMAADLENAKEANREKLEGERESARDKQTDKLESGRESRTQELIAGRQELQDNKTPTKSETDKYVGDYLAARGLPDTPANRQKARDAKATEERPPAQGTFMPLYGKDGQVVGAWNPANGQVQHAPGLPGNTAGGVGIGDKQAAALDKKIAPFRNVVEESGQADALKDAADKGNAEADVALALTFFKAMRAGTTGGSGIRFTQQENNLIMGARNLFGSLQVAGNKVLSNGEPLSHEQRKEILDVIHIYRDAAQRHIQEAQGSSGGQAAPAGGGAIPSFKDFMASQGAH